MGQLANEVRQNIEKMLADKIEELKAREVQREIESMPVFDISVPMEAAQGSYHPITLVQRQCEAVFKSMGFAVEEYSEIVTDYECFEALNIPKDHPARDMQDTYYLENGQLLKSHTSAAQNAIYKKYRDALVNQGKPIKAIFPGRCFRNEATDACHFLPDGRRDGGQKHFHFQSDLFYENDAFRGVSKGYSGAPAPRLFPIRGTGLRIGHQLSDLRRRRVRLLQAQRLAGALPLRYDSPRGLKGGRN